MKKASATVLTAGLALTGCAQGCAPSEPNNLDKLAKVRLRIKEADFEVWIADTSATRERGLMKVTAEQMADLPDGAHRGMLFVFDYEQWLSFWMKDTIIPLDIAYLTTSGTITATHTMTPLDVRPNRYPSGQAARFALEVKANLWAQLGVAKGDQIEIPTSVLKTDR